MSSAALQLCIPRPGVAWSQRQIDAVSPCLENMSAEERLHWALEYLPAPHVMSSSFGAQSAVMLHLVTQAIPDIPVLLADTGYLFPETYKFIDQLTERLNLNLQVVRPQLSSAWQEARHGKRWESGVDGIHDYNRENKVEPIQQAMQDLHARTWFAGLRRVQTNTRQQTPVLQLQDGRAKIHPIVDWTDRQVHQYLKQHRLPYHPLWSKGYVSIGDWHTSRPLGPDISEEETRFFGLVRECGLHQPLETAAERVPEAQPSEIKISAAAGR